MISPELNKKIKFKKQLKQIDSQYIISVGKFNNYYPCTSPQEIINFAQQYGYNNCIAEVSINNKMICPFFDYDLKTKTLSLEEQLNVKQQLHQTILNVFPNLNIKFYIKDASNNTQTSLHFIIRMTHDNIPVYFRSKTQVEQFFKFLKLQKPFDLDAHKGFCLRTLHSDKYGFDNKLVMRKFIRSSMSDHKTDIKSLICYCPSYNDMWFFVDDYVKRNFILQLVRELGFEKDYGLDQVQQRPQDQHLSLQLTEQKCHRRQHQSNNCVCMLFSDCIIVKCHDGECPSLKHNIENQIFQINIVNNNNNDDSNDQQIIISQENKDVMNAREQIMQTREVTGSDVQEITQLEKGGFHALIKHPEYSGFEQTLRNLIGSDGIVQHTLSDGRIVEFAQSSSLQKALEKLTKTYSNEDIQNVVHIYNQFNININVQQNFYGEQEDQVSGKNLNELFNNCTDKFLQQFQNFSNKEIYEQIGYFVIRGQKNQCIQTIVNYVQKDNFILSNKESLFYFDNEQNKWTSEDGINIGLNNIKNFICGFLFEIQAMLEKKSDKVSSSLYKKIQEITLKQTENLQYQTYLHLLRKKDHEFDIYGNLLHFKNSTYNLLNNSFVENSSNYFNTIALKFNMSYDIMLHLEEKVKYLNQIIDDILPNKNVKNWFLYSIVNNLIQTSKQKPIVFMKGVGSNGKSFLIQLIRNSLGPYCYKGQSTIFQKDTIQDSTKSTGTIGDAINSRICYIEELSSNQINIEKLKELTGGGTIPTRKLHQDFVEQEIKCQFYVACNNIPNFGKQVDQAIKNRIVAVPFDTEFVDNPVEDYQKQKRDITNIVKEIEYQQAFLVLLLKYNFEQRNIPQEILVYTQEMKDDIDKDIQLFNQYIIPTKLQSDYIIKEDFKKFVQDILGETVKQNFKSPIIGKFRQWLIERDCLNEERVNGKRCYIGIKFIDQYKA